MKPIFYVYELINPETGNVFYVGKGKEDRMYFHERSVRSHQNPVIRDTNPHLYHTLYNLIASGSAPLYRKLADKLSENAAFDLERETIRNYRDRGLNLCNITDGGEGQAGYGRPLSDLEREIISARMKGVPKTLAHRQALREAKLKNPVRYWSGKDFNDNHRARLSSARKKFLQTEKGKQQLKRSQETQREQKRKSIDIGGVSYRGTWGELKEQTGLSKYKILRKIERGEAKWAE